MSSQSPIAPGPTDLVTLNRAAVVARLFAGVAHEVNNALQVIGGTTELLQAMPGVPEGALQGLRRIMEQHARAAAVVAEAMVVTRAQPQGRSRVNLREVASRAAALRSFAIGRARLTMAVDADPANRNLVDGDPALLQLAALNLVINAEQALAGRPGGAIRVVVTEAPGSVLLQVVDNGPGVDPALAEQIFEPFFTTRPRETSSGLGLTVARMIAEQHGGALLLVDCGPGACFELRLPGV
jgi:signal transduction histidine kinase